MNRSIYILTVLLALLVCVPLASTAEDRIATVDLRKVFDGYWKTLQANDAIKERGEELERELKGLVTDFESSKEEYQSLLESANDQAVSITEREKRKRRRILQTRLSVRPGISAWHRSLLWKSRVQRHLSRHYAREGVPDHRRVLMGPKIREIFPCSLVGGSKKPMNARLPLAR